MSAKFDLLYNDYLRRYRPWKLTGRPAWEYYYRPWRYYPFNPASYYDPEFYDRYRRYYDKYYDYFYDRDLERYYKYRPYYDTSAIEDYVKSIDKLDNLRCNIDKLREELDLSSRSIDDKLDESSRCVRGQASKSASRSASRGDLSIRGDAELSRSYRLAADALDVDDDILDTQIWSEAAPRPRLACNATPYREQINSLRLKSLRLEEKRLLEIRRLQELERLRGPQPKWYELKTPQFCVEAKKNNEILAAKKQWNTYRDYTESVWKSKDLSRSMPNL